MKKILLFLITVTAGIIFFSCSRKVQQSTALHAPQKIGEILQKPLVVRNNYFAFDLMRTILDKEDNMIVSPFSISAAMAMTYAGARENTAREMSQTLYFDGDQDAFHQGFGTYLAEVKGFSAEDAQLNIANSLWAQQGYYFLPEFFEIMEQQYGSELFQVNYKDDREAIRQNINSWALNQTREKINNLIAPGVLTEDTRLVLVNAIHFLGSWTTKFQESQTRKQAFFAQDGQQTMTDFMTQKAYHLYYEGHGLQALEKPYADGRFSMVILLPGAETDLPTALSKLDGDVFEDIVKNMQRTHVDLRMPKFKIESSFYLEETLGRMGMPLAFSEKADFSGMTGTDSLMIDKVIHKAMIDVKESGTEAAAATAVVMITKTSIEAEPEKTVIFQADRPFIFMIKENQHNGILFMGTFMKP